jgi:hypothetical protein
VDGFASLYDAQDYEDKLIKWQLIDWWNADLIYNPTPNFKRTQTEMNIKERYPTRLVRGQDLTQPIVALITGVRDEEMAKGAGKTPEPVLVVYFENVTTGKPARMASHAYVPGLGHGFSGRKVLANQIAELLGSWDTDQWIGRKIELYAVDARAGRDMVKSIAARLPVEQPAKKNGKVPATIEDRKAGLLAWADKNTINEDNRDAIVAKVDALAHDLGFELPALTTPEGTPAGRLAALVAHIRPPQPATTEPVIEGDVSA